ncbi:enamine deaminase RidA [Aliidongia dinghuensis]|uniref:Enamine deaminase RidA n=1 Tax=Aliidongia dinghuensis TaxID=1867774 RepID=A0A8J2YYA6_9PROT|nr:RidA family protein [Aliidongia dinghuensis]GGF36344.1 enamine deaminase RidA [Aliidongia dinghuensis]
MSGLRFLQPPGWPKPKGYANGVAASGETIFVGGQIGWDVGGRFADGLPAQIGQALENILAVLAEAGAGPGDITRLTWYLVDVEDYLAHQAEIGAAYRRIMGRHFPAMAVVEVRRLVERQALVEIEATAVRAPSR